MRTITKEELKTILENHQHWLKEDCDGWKTMRADLRYADLRYAEQAKGAGQADPWRIKQTCRDSGHPSGEPESGTANEVRALRKLTYLPFILTAIAILAACLWVALPHEEKETQVNPVEMTAPAPVRVYIPHHEDVRRTENGYVYCDAVPLSDGWQAYTQDTCRRYGLDYALMLGLMETESSFREDADSGWAYGLCQIGYINEDDLASMGMDIYTTQGNIEAGCYILSDLMTRHSVSESLMAYNMGEYGAGEFWAQGITESQYSRDVLAAAQRWEERLR